MDILAFNWAMNNIFFPLIAFVAGVAIATQASMNAQLGVLVKNAVLATTVAFLNSFIFTLIVLIFFAKRLPGFEIIKAVPYYLWFAGGLLSTFGVGAFYWLIPKMGVGSMISYALSGQLILAMVAGHFGLFQLPVTPISTPKIVGALFLILGIIFTNKG
jgi:transporter family-2 protein